MPPGPKPRTKEAQSAATRARLIAVARKHFAREGFEAAATEAIVAEAEVTRGALYHQFSDKKALFRAVVEAIHAEITIEIERSAAKAKTPLDALLTGSEAFLRASQRADNLRPFLIDGPSVLGWQDWRALDARHGARSLAGGLRAYADGAGLDPAIGPGALLHAVNGMLTETALALTAAKDKAALLRQSLAILARLLTNVASKPRRP